MYNRPSLIQIRSVLLYHMGVDVAHSSHHLVQDMPVHMRDCHMVVGHQAYQHFQPFERLLPDPELPAMLYQNKITFQVQFSTAQMCDWL